MGEISHRNGILPAGSFGNWAAYVHDVTMGGWPRNFLLVRHIAILMGVQFIHGDATLKTILGMPPTPVLLKPLATLRPTTSGNDQSIHYYCARTKKK